MSDENLKLRIKLELDKADESLKGARVLFESDLYDETVSSAYYAMFHMTKAILLTVNQEPSTHQGLISQFGLYFIKPKMIEQEYSDLLIDAKESRETGDYDAARKFTKDEACEKLENAVKFNKRIRDYLKEKSLIN